MYEEAYFYEVVFTAKNWYFWGWYKKKWEKIDILRKALKNQCFVASLKCGPHMCAQL